MDENNVCQALWDGAVIHFSGAVFACDSMSEGPEMESMILGNLKDDSLINILNNHKIQELRKKILSGKTEGLLCHRCNKKGTCNLYDDPVSGTATRKNQHPSSKQVNRVNQPKAMVRLELGLTDLCNMKCTMCCLSEGKASPYFLPKKGMMNIEIAKKAIAEATELATEPLLLLLHWVGEPLIYPHLIELLDWIAQFNIKLHFVTNGILLKPKIIEKLLSLRGENVINISLNAITDQTYQEINQVDKLSIVTQNIEYLLQERKKRKIENWVVLMTSVVLKENYQEMPNFVSFWRNKLEQYGSVDVGLNGKGAKTNQQIYLLRELEKPLSAVYFRESLRLSGLEKLYPDIETWRVVDDILLGKKTTDKIFDISLNTEQIHLLCERNDLSNQEIRYLLLLLQDKPPDLSVVLQKLITKNYRLRQLPFVPQDDVNLLLWLQLVPESVVILKKRLQKIAWNSVERIKNLALLLAHYPTMAQYLPEKIDFSSVDAQVEDASFTIISLAKKENTVVLSNIPLEWQVETIAGLISRCDHVHFQFHLTIELAIQTVYARFISFVAHTNIQHLADLLSDFDQKEAPDWLIRATRRRWFFAGKGQISWKAPNGLQASLLGLLVGTDAFVPQLLQRIANSLHSEIMIELPQDLAEIMLKRKVVKEHKEWAIILERLLQQLRCPLLKLPSAYSLGIAVLLEQNQLLNQEIYHQANKKIRYDELEIWQQEQWEALAVYD